MAKTGTKRRRWVVVGVAAAGALLCFAFLAGGCKKKESASERAGREARETFEKSKDLLKEGLEKTKELTKEGVEKTGEAAKGFQKGWKEGGK